jgi:protein-S-isoprenylcysteine O-methyltransferase Ste14
MEQAQLALTVSFLTILSFKYLFIKIKLGKNPLLFLRGSKPLYVKIVEFAPVLLTAILLITFLIDLFWIDSLPRFAQIVTFAVPVPTVISYIGMLIGLLSFYFLILGYFHMGNSWKIGIGNEKCAPLVTEGVFSLTRNPVYVFLNLFSLSFFLSSGKLIFLGLFVLIAISLHLLILEEERFLTKHYKEEFKKYKKEVPRYL